MKENTKLQKLALNYLETRTEESFKRLYKVLKPSLKSFISSKYLKKNDWSHDEIEDVISIIFSKIYKSIDSYDPYYQFSTWAYTIAKNEALKSISDRNKRNEVSFTSYSGGQERGIQNFGEDFKLKYVLQECVDDYVYLPNYDYIIDGNESEVLMNAIMDQIELLPEKYRKVIIDREVNNLSYQDIANKHEMNLNTAKVHIHKGRKILQKRLQKVYQAWKNSV